MKQNFLARGKTQSLLSASWPESGCALKKNIHKSILASEWKTLLLF